jgi:UDP-N-acetylmuramoyl-tripeptide--D-alanyl-D-alanine ligase
MFFGYEAAEICGGRLYGDKNAFAKNVSTDSREISEGDLFVALKGENFDGNDYIGAAFENGALICVASKYMPPPEGRCMVLVRDTGEALLQLAAYHRRKFDIHVIGITGSVGKTTTKELVASGLSVKMNILKTEGNFNNEIGLPKTIFRLRPEHEAAVLEMGMSASGEISRLSKTARPDIALITNIGLTHIENLGSVENILAAKLEILDGLKEGGTLVLNADDPHLGGLSSLPCKTVFYGIEKPCDFFGEVINDTAVRFEGTDIVLPMEGRHNLSNAMAAVAAGSLLGLSAAEIARGIEENFVLDGKRQTTITHPDGFTVICDFYNASPTAVAAALRVLGSKKGRKIAVLGDMLELGRFSPECHRETGELAAKNGVEILLGYGDNSRHTVAGAKDAGVSVCAHYDSKEKLAAELKKMLLPGDFVLIKGSRGMKMEEIYEKIMG